MVGMGKYQKKRLVSLSIVLFALSLAILFLVNVAAGEVIYGGGNVEPYSSVGPDQAKAMAADNQGNVYVTGSSLSDTTEWDYLTIKYGFAGQILWARHYSGPGDDEATAIATDSQGNVFVTGTSDGGESGWDILTIKYSPTGEELWSKRYNRSDGDDIATAIATDGQGNVYVAGATDGAGLGWDYLILKYNADGQFQWAIRYDGPGHAHDIARALTVDGQGNIYVTGESFGSDNTGYDYATIKYDADHDRIWVRRYDGPGHGYDSACAIAVDDQGNVYVTGTVTVSEIDPDSLSEEDVLNNVEVDTDYATIKYSSDGTQVWVMRYDGPGNGFDEAKAMVLDGEGNVYVTGVSYGGVTGADYATVKYHFNRGTQLWVSRYNGPVDGRDEAKSIAVNSQGEIHVTGTSEASEGDFDYVTLKYSPDGTEIWIKGYAGSAGEGDCASAVVVDSLGKVRVTGSSWRGDSNDLDFVTINYF